VKQTAVEWQFEQLFNSFEKFNNRECTFNDFLIRNLEIRKQAKEMEKEQKKFFFECGRNFQLTGEGTFEEVCNETFKQPEQ